MTDKSKVLEKIFDKVEKRFNMMSSDSEGERVNACNSLYDLLKKENITFVDLWQLGWNANKDKLAELLKALLQDDTSLLVKIGQERVSYFTNDAVFADVEVRGLDPREHALVDLGRRIVGLTQQDLDELLDVVPLSIDGLEGGEQVAVDVGPGPGRVLDRRRFHDPGRLERPEFSVFVSYNSAGFFSCFGD
jgi:hypothetical protein